MAAKKYVYSAKLTNVYFDEFNEKVYGKFFIEKDMQEENELGITEDREIEIWLKDLLKYDINFEAVNFEHLLEALEEKEYDLEVSKNFKVNRLADGTVYDDIKQYVEYLALDISVDDLDSNFEAGYETYLKLI